MDKKYKIIKQAIIATVILLFWFVLEVAFSPKNSDIFTIESNGYSYKYQVSSSKIFGMGEVVLLESDNDGNVIIPETVYKSSSIIPNFYTVVGVNINGLSGDIVIPKTVSKIIKYNYSSLIPDGRNIVLYTSPKSIKVVRDNPYLDSRYDCNCVIDSKTNTLLSAASKDFFIPEGVEEIATGAFNGDFSEIKMPSTLKVIHSFAFFNCQNLKNVLLNDGLEVIEDCAFYRMQAGGTKQENLIYLPSTLKSFSFYSFANYIDFIFLYDGNDIDSILTNKCLGTKVGNNQEIRFGSAHNLVNNSTSYYVDNISSDGMLIMGDPEGLHGRDIVIPTWEVFYTYSETHHDGKSEWHYVNGIPVIYEII